MITTKRSSVSVRSGRILSTILFSAMAALGGACASASDSHGDTNGAPSATGDNAGGGAGQPNGDTTPEARRRRDAGAPAVDAGGAAQDSGVARDSGATSDAGGGNNDAGAHQDAAPPPPPPPPPPTCNGGGGGGANGGPADLFPCDSPWYKDVSALAPASDQSAMSGVQWGNANSMKIDFSIKFMHASGAAPQHVTLDTSYDPDNDHIDVPVPVSGQIEDETGYACTGGGDCHLIVVDDSTHRLFELWQANKTASGWTATQESMWDLTKHYGPTGRGDGCTSADAAGFPIMAGLIGVNETAAGEIRHALRFILPNNQILKNGYVAPATHSTAAYSGKMPMGTRLRLKASFDESRLASAGARTIARALKKYGMMLADAGNDALTAESDALEATKWGSLLGRNDLSALGMSDFEIVDYGAVHVHSMDCVRTP